MRNCGALAATLAAVFTMAVAGAAWWLDLAGATVAGAAASSRAAGLLTHTHASGGLSPSSAAGSGPAGSDIMALFVTGMAVSAVALPIVTFVRRRTATA